MTIDRRDPGQVLDELADRAWLRLTDDLGFPSDEQTAELARDCFDLGFYAALQLVGHATQASAGTPARRWPGRLAPSVPPTGPPVG